MISCFYKKIHKYFYLINILLTMYIFVCYFFSEFVSENELIQLSDLQAEKYGNLDDIGSFDNSQ